MISWDDLPLSLTVAEAAKLLRVKPNHVYELVRTHELPHTHLGRAIRIPRDQLRQHIESPHPISVDSPVSLPLQFAQPRTQVRTVRAQLRRATGG